MLKQSKIAILMISVIAIAMVAPASAYLSSQNIETKAERMVDIADGARDRVLELVDLIEADATAMELITGAGLDGQFYANVSLCVEEGTTVGGEETLEDGEGWTYLDTANQTLLAEEYEEAIDNAREALTIFRDVLRAINVILVDAGVEIEQPLDVEVIQEAIDRSLNRVKELEELISVDAPIYEKLIEANDTLTTAIELLLLDNVENAKSSLRDANVLISEVCQYLKEIAQELNPQRIRDYCAGAYQYRERFRERFGQAGNEGFDVDGFLQGFGFQSEDEFMARFQDTIQNAESIEDIEDALGDLEEIGRLIREMDQNLTQEMGRYRAQHGQAGSGSGFGQESSGSGYGQEASGSGYGQKGNGYGGSGGSGQMGFGGGQ
jgi:hypothetical protein